VSDNKSRALEQRARPRVVMRPFKYLPKPPQWMIRGFQIVTWCMLAWLGLMFAGEHVASARTPIAEAEGRDAINFYHQSGLMLPNSADPAFTANGLWRPDLKAARCNQALAAVSELERTWVTAREHAGHPIYDHTIAAEYALVMHKALYGQRCEDRAAVFAAANRYDQASDDDFAIRYPSDVLTHVPVPRWTRGVGWVSIASVHHYATRNVFTASDVTAWLCEEDKTHAGVSLEQAINTCQRAGS
jgi:hypothetical protein